MSLTQTLSERLSIHHVGGRAGSRAFPVLDKFERDIVNVLYDADADCLPQIKEANKGFASELRVLPYCLADENKLTSININYDPYTSSVYEPNPSYRSFYTFNRDHDYLLSEAYQVMEKRQLNSVTLDHVIRQENIPAPDFLSIDTQGSEYEILKGAKEVLRSDVVALVLEAEFHPIYKGQKLFGDLSELLTEQGFFFVKFLQVSELSPYRGPIGFRGDGFQFSSDALFLKNIEKIDPALPPEKRSLMLRKLAFIAFLFNQFEYGLQCLQESKKIKNVSPSAGDEPVYMKFLEKLESELEKLPSSYYPTFTNKFTSYAMSRSRFEVKKEQVRSSAQFKQTLLKKVPALFMVWRAIKRIRPTTQQAFHRMFLTNNGIEKLFLEYGLNFQAKLLQERRFSQTVRF